MESMNKFKVLTVVIICLFLFVVAAIYSNTKDASAGKKQVANAAVEEKSSSQDVSESESPDANADSENVQDSQEPGDLATQINLLNQRVDSLNERVNNYANSNSNGTGLDCKIYGTMTPTGVEELTPEAAVQEAKVNDKEIVITCSLN